ncbi:MAG: DUF433 domain-containing protein [Flavobacteriales bacterium]
MFAGAPTIDSICLPFKYVAASERDNPLAKPMRAFLKRVHALAEGHEALATGSAALHAEQFQLRMQVLHWLVNADVDLIAAFDGIESKWREQADTPERKKLLKALLHALEGQRGVFASLESAGHSLESVVQQTVQAVAAAPSYAELIAGMRMGAPDSSTADKLQAWIDCSLDVETALLLADAYLCHEVTMSAERAEQLNSFLVHANKAFKKGLEHWVEKMTPNTVAAEPAVAYRVQGGMSETTTRTLQASKPSIGTGAFSVPEIALILGLKQNKVRRVLNELWDGRIGKQMFGDTFSLTVADHKFVSFHVLIEFYVYFELRERGVSSQKIMKARQVMASDLKTDHPFATAHVLHTKKKIWYAFKEDIVDADGSRQTNINEIIERFCDKIDFNGEALATRFWPLGKDKQVVVDPKHQFGAPTVPGTNINAQVLHAMSKSGERVEVLASLYDLSEKEVRDAILLYDRAA